MSSTLLPDTLSLFSGIEAISKGGIQVILHLAFKPPLVS